MSAPTPAPGDDRPREGYYPDPSIPGYVRYWNGAAWVPGTSRPAPGAGESLPLPPGADPAQAAVVQPGEPAPAAAEETGPLFFDQDPSPGVPEQTGPAGSGAQQGPGHPGQLETSAGGSRPGHTAEPPRSVPPGAVGEHGSRPEPASAWGADASRQSGFGEPDARVSWGASRGADPRLSGGPAEPPSPPDAQAAGAEGTMTFRPGPDGSPPAGSGEGPDGGTVTFRRPGPEPGGGPSGRPEGTMAIRVDRTDGQARTGAPGTGADAPYQQGGIPQQSAGAFGPGTGAPQIPGQFGGPGTAGPPSPAQFGGPQQPGVPGAGQQPGAPGPGQQSWAQDVRQLAQSAPETDEPVVPWKPPVSDPFLAAAQAQAAARPAPLGKRLAARLVDTVVVGAVTAAVAVPEYTSARDHVHDKIDAAKLTGETVKVWLLDGTTGTALAVVLAVLLVFGALYEALPTAKWGRTLGKKLLGLEVRDIEGHQPPRIAAALRRWLVLSVPGVLVIGVVGVLWCLFDQPWRQCWHDKAAHTFVAG